MPRPTPSVIAAAAFPRWRENRLLRTDRGDDVLSWKLGEQGADFGDATPHSPMSRPWADGLGSKPMTTRGAHAGGDSLVVGFSFSLGFSSRGENSCDKFPADPNCDTLAVRVNARGLFPVMFALLSLLVRSVLPSLVLQIRPVPLPSRFQLAHSPSLSLASTQPVHLNPQDDVRQHQSHPSFSRSLQPAKEQTSHNSLILTLFFTVRNPTHELKIPHTKTNGKFNKPVREIFFPWTFNTETPLACRILHLLPQCDGEVTTLILHTAPDPPNSSSYPLISIEQLHSPLPDHSPTPRPKPLTLRTGRLSSKLAQSCTLSILHHSVVRPPPPTPTCTLKNSKRTTRSTNADRTQHDQETNHLSKKKLSKRKKKNPNTQNDEEHSNVIALHAIHEKRCTE
jgi:hypothetical protein